MLRRGVLDAGSHGPYRDPRTLGARPGGRTMIGPLLAGGAVPAVLTVWASVLLGVGGFFLPDILTRTEAVEQRAEFRHALSSFLDLVVIVLAAGGGVTSALAMAAAGGGGWAFERLGDALAASRLTRETPWAALG